MASMKTSTKKSTAKKATAKQAAKKSITKKSAKKSPEKPAAKKSMTEKAGTKATAKKVAQKPTAKKVAQKPTAKKVAGKPTVKKVKKQEHPSPVRSSATQLPVSALPGEGDRVPPFSLANQDGQMLDSSSLAGERYVLYFYPKDDTPGCTTEACGFRDELAQFTQAKVRIIGVSPDKPVAHQRFAKKYSLPFTLLCDPDHTLSTGLGVWALKNNYGREYMGIIRSTFLVNEDGVIEKVWRNVRVAGHVPAVLEAATQS